MHTITSLQNAKRAMKPCVLETALDRLGAYLDAEQDTLGALLAQTGRRHASWALDALTQLHIEPDHRSTELRELLEEALIYVEIILDAVSRLPTRCPLQSAWGWPGSDAVIRVIQWSGARLSDMHATLRNALERSDVC